MQTAIAAETIADAHLSPVVKWGQYNHLRWDSREWKAKSRNSISSGHRDQPLARLAILQYSVYASMQAVLQSVVLCSRTRSCDRRPHFGYPVTLSIGLACLLGWGWGWRTTYRSVRVPANGWQIWMFETLTLSGRSRCKTTLSAPTDWTVKYGGIDQSTVGRRIERYETSELEGRLREREREGVWAAFWQKGKWRKIAASKSYTRQHNAKAGSCRLGATHRVHLCDLRMYCTILYKYIYI